MKTRILRTLIFPLLSIAILLSTAAAAPAVNRRVPPPAAQAQVPTLPPAPTAILPTATQQQASGTKRPIVIVSSYTSGGEIRPGQDFDLQVSLYNSGQHSATNVFVTFTPGDLIPRETGGARTEEFIHPGNSWGFNQPMTASPALVAGNVASVSVSVSYNDADDGTPYTSTYSLSFHVAQQQASSGAIRPTATATAILKPQLVISHYTTDVDPLQPGSRFRLQLEVINLGTTDARSITMIVGGGPAPSGDGTPVPGTSGTSGDFSTFAPLNSSNLEFIGDIKAAEKTDTAKDLIVNVTANPGAYSLKFSFVYTDSKGTRYFDDQVITLLVYTLPAVDVSFYRTPDPFFAGQPGVLPIQVYNVGRKQTILGNLRVNAPEGAQVMNNTLLVGVMDPGMYNTLDAQIIPDRPGTMEIPVVINYNDDFNQPRSIEQTLTIEVMEMMMEPPPTDGINGGGGGGGGQVIDVPVTVEETFIQKVLRFFKGLLGLNSSTPTPAGEPGMDGVPVDPGNGEPVIKPVAPPVRAPSKG